MEDGSPHRGLPRPEEGDGRSTATGPDQLTGHPSMDTCTCGRGYPVFDSPEEDDPPLKGSGDEGPRPVPIPCQAQDPFPKANCAGDPGDLKKARWPMNPVALPWNARCPGDTGKFGTHGRLSCKDGDPFRTVDDLTARETQWRATTQVASMNLENVQEFLRISL